MRLTSFLNLSFNQDNQWASTLETTFTEEKQKQEIIKTAEQDGKKQCYTRVKTKKIESMTVGTERRGSSACVCECRGCSH